MADDFATTVRELFTQAHEADKVNREEAMKDLEFVAGEHWDKQVREYRERMGIEKYGFPLPCLTINDLPQKSAQVIGDRQANATSIKFLPKEDGDKAIADIRSELTRSIELHSRADRAYMAAFKPAVNCGIGNFRVDLDYANEDVFERDLFIRSIPNPMAVIWDETAADPTGRDAGFCFVSEKMRTKVYEERFKDAAKSELFDAEVKSSGWVEGDYVRIAEYWRMEERDRTLAMMQDGSVVDVTDKPRESWLGNVLVGPKGPMIREKAKCRYAIRQLTNGQEELDDPFELKIPRLPIIRVMGGEIWVGDRRVRYGLVRFARDPAMLKDYNRSVRAEMLMLAPRANWAAEARAVEGRESDWVNTMIYNDGAQPPTPMTHQNTAALLEEAQLCAQDMKDVTGLHDASLGMRSNETSGIAIQRRQHEGDIATIDYHGNMNAAQQEAGEVINALIPVVYDTTRTIRLVGEDDAIKLQRINDPNDPESVDLSKGRYDVTVTTGPAYMTKRQEAAASMMEAGRVAPQLFEVAGDLMAKAQDWPGAEVIAERLKRAVPPQYLGADEQNDDDPEAAQAAKAKAEEAERLQGLMQQLQVQTQMLTLEKLTAEVRKANADAEAAERKPDIDGFNAETNRIKAITAKDFPLPPEAVAILAPIVTQAVMNALASPDILPLDVQNEISESAFDTAANPPMPTEPEGMPL